MKKNLLLIISLFFCSFSFSQGDLNFSYDSAGNQISRYRVCVGCSSTLLAEKSQDTLLLDAVKKDSLSSLTGERVGFVAYPNPVTNILQTYWHNTDNKYITQMSVYSTKHELLFFKRIPKEEEALDIDFSRYPSGIYILEFLFNTREKEFFRVIKK
ncbi:MAG TPA: T9SS type A sorting domain-containing protein [Salinimicrobium sp.]|nr:T9SS type A sorting domain-containing protein [Salinimicrobium sp.]